MDTETLTIEKYKAYKEILELSQRYLSDISDINEQYKITNNNSIKNKHDKTMKKLLENKKDVIQLIERVIGKNEKINEDNIEIYNSSFISDKLESSESDIVYKMKDKDVFFLIEHQSYIDNSMPYRILKYKMEIMDLAIDKTKYKNKNYEFPIVIPIVLYTGHKKWDVELNIINKQLNLDVFKLDEFSEYKLIDVNDIDNEELLESDSLLDKTILLEKSKNEEEMNENLNKIIERIEKDEFNIAEEQEDISIIVISNLATSYLDNEKIQHYIKRLKKGGNKNMLAMYEMMRKEGIRVRREARTAGLNEGRKEGRMAEKIEIIKNMLADKMPIEKISKFTGMKKEEIEKIK